MDKSCKNCRYFKRNNGIYSGGICSKLKTASNNQLAIDYVETGKIESIVEESYSDPIFVQLKSTIKDLILEKKLSKKNADMLLAALKDDMEDYKGDLVSEIAGTVGDSFMTWI